MKGVDNAATILLSQPLDRNRIWTPYASFIYRKATVIKDNIRMTGEPRPLTLGLIFNKADAWGKTRLDLAPVVVGEKWLGGKSVFFRSRATALRTFDLPHDNQLVFRGAWQFATSPSVWATMYQLGGEYTVRGYTEGLITADSSQYYSIEHYWPVPIVGQHGVISPNRLKGVTFVDFGQGWLLRNNHRYTPQSNTFSHSALMAVGLGLRFRLSQYAQGFMDVAWGVFNRTNIELASQPTFRIHFGIRSDLLPQKWMNDCVKEPKK